MNRRDLNKTTRWPFWAFMVVVVCFIYQELIGGVSKDEKIEYKLHMWLNENRLSFVVEMLENDGIVHIYGII